MRPRPAPRRGRAASRTPERPTSTGCFHPGGVIEEVRRAGQRTGVDPPRLAARHQGSAAGQHRTGDEPGGQQIAAAADLLQDASRRRPTPARASRRPRHARSTSAPRSTRCRGIRVRRVDRQSGHRPELRGRRSHVRTAPSSRPPLRSRRAFRGPVRRPVEPRPAGGHVDLDRGRRGRGVRGQEAEHLVVQLQIRDGDGREQGVLPVSVSLVTVPMPLWLTPVYETAPATTKQVLAAGKVRVMVCVPRAGASRVIWTCVVPALSSPRAVTVWVSKVTEVGSALPELPRWRLRRPAAGRWSSLRQCAARKRSSPRRSRWSRSPRRWRSGSARRP